MDWNLKLGIYLRKKYYFVKADNYLYIKNPPGTVYENLTFSSIIKNKIRVMYRINHSEVILKDGSGRKTD